MALNKQNLNINFAQGLDTKTDPWQVSPGKFLALQNSIFTKGGLLQKRNGYQALASLPNTTFEHVTTFNGNLTAIGNRLSAYSQGSSSWIDTGAIQPMDLSVVPMVRSSTNQTQADSVVSGNNLVCTVYSDNNGSTTTLKYVITDYLTNQVIVPSQLIVPSAGTIIDSPRVFLLSNYFIIIFGTLIGGTNHLQYIAVNTNLPSTATTAVDISAQYTPTTTMNFDAVVANNSIYIAWNASDVGGAIRIQRMDSTLVQHGTVVGPGTAGTSATYLSICADTTANTPVVWVFYFNATTFGQAFAVDQNLNTVLSTTTVIASNTPATVQVTCAAQNGVMTLFYEILTKYTYDSTIVTDHVRTKTVTQAGVVGTGTTLVRSVGLASKAFIVKGNPYFLGVYGSVFQPTYFLINGVTGGVVAKLAYSNGSANLTGTNGYLPTGLPSAVVQSNGSTVNVAYLFKDLIQSVNKSQGVASAAGIYSQTGINLANITFDNQDVITAEIGNNLNLTGGLTMSYDGAVPVEQNFNLWPDYVELTPATTGGGLLAQQYFYQAIYEWTDAQGNIFRSAPSIPVTTTTKAGTGITFTSTFSSGASSITVSSATGLFVGQVITDNTTGANITVGTYITSIVGTTIGLSLPTAGNSAGGGDTLKTVQTASVVVNIPTMRLTYKTANPIKIVLYRWSTAQQSYFQITSVTNPLLNDTTVDSVAFTDSLSDQAIIGNSLIYTTGGVVEDIAPPASTTMTLFKSRLFMVDAEDRNLLWYSKQVIEGTPVEMSDLFTIYVAPTVGAQGNTGPITALSAMDDKLIIFKKDAIYYMTGIGPDNTGAQNDFSDPVFITSTIGCANQNSIVFMPNGLMFQSDKGIWLLGRDLNTTYIGAAVENFNSALVESAITVPGTNQVRFTLDSGVTLMYDYFYGQWGTFYNIPALASTLYQGLHVFINKFGQVYQETPGQYLDGSNPVCMSFTTSWLNLAGLQGYERAYMFYLLGNYISPHRLVLSIAYEYHPAPTQQTIITPNNYNAPYGSDQTYGQSTPYGGTATLEQWKVHLQRQTCQSLQITLTELYDPSLGADAGAGLTLSGINMTLGIKKGYRPIKAANSVG